MGLFDNFTGSGAARAARAASHARSQQFDRSMRDLQGSRLLARGALDTGRNDLIAGRENALRDLYAGANRARAAIGTGGDRALSYLQDGTNGARDLFDSQRAAFDSAGDQFDDLAAMTDPFDDAADILADAQGLNGAEGLARAKDAFANSLQNNHALDQGVEAIARRRAATGGGSIAGGNVDRDTLIFGQDLANSQSGQYLDRLLGLTDRRIGTADTAASGRANAFGNIAQSYGAEAGLLERSGVGQAGVAADTAARLADLARGTGQSAADIHTRSGVDLAGNRAGLAGAELGAANDLAGLRSQQGNQLADAILQTRQARDQASANLFGLGLSGLQQLAALAGASPSFGRF